MHALVLDKYENPTNVICSGHLLRTVVTCQSARMLKVLTNLCSEDNPPENCRLPPMYAYDTASDYSHSETRILQDRCRFAVLTSSCSNYGMPGPAFSILRPWYFLY